MQVGKTYQVMTKDTTYVGRYMPDSDSSIVRLKLDSGYNVGVARSKIVKATQVKKKVVAAKKVKKPVQKQSLPKVAILHTGGTVASKVDYETGGVSAQFSDADLLHMFPELGEVAQISSSLVANMFSSDMNFNHINQIAEAVFKQLKKTDVQGVVVTHGTDTLAFTAAALSFMLSGLEKPVVVVGAQRSSDRPSSDAALNLLCAVHFAAKADCGEVVCCMHDTSEDTLCSILPGVKVKKLHTSRRDAFACVNDGPLATVDVAGNIHMFRDARVYTGKLGLTLLNPRLKIGVVVSRPNMSAKDVLCCEGYDGVVLLGGGLGHMPVQQVDDFTKGNAGILRAIKKLAKAMPVVMTSNCVYGRNNMQVYSYGRKLIEAGVLGNLLDMHFEAAYMKLAYVLSLDKGRARELYSENFRGEITPRSDYL